MFFVLGIAICVGVLLQVSLWISSTISELNYNRSQFDASKRLLEEQIAHSELTRVSSATQQQGRWQGYREFVVDRLEKNVAMVTSVYLKPVDGKPIASFKAGQYLSLKFDVPGEAKPLVRCYSLSTGPNKDYYRISVKSVAPPPDRSELPPGRVSHFVNNELLVGDRIEVKAPGGSFYLEDKGDAPIVLLAGGIGITPMLSMLDDLVRKASQRLIVLFYGVRNGREHAFADEIKQLAAKHDNVHVITCYSNPDPHDRANEDYQVQGFVSVDMIKVLLPHNRCRFYLCGPPPFMESLRNGLLDWEVPEQRINYEAFGPATIKKTSSPGMKNNEVSETSLATSDVVFAASGKKVTWNSNVDSLLELAEANDVAIDSGCRAGSCGTCSTRLTAGKVCYPEGMDPECDAGECLPCIAKPEGRVELDA